mmetsp:Transcript_43455/g.57518  ORF Transcript_43455/g.57518 Transcript_43455/m.57518 type:complete len:85 (+) Transcript_43455:1536-1790(+)
MTTHMFALKTPDELEEQQQQPKDSGGFFSRFLPLTFTLERSKIRLNILEDVAPVEPPAPVKPQDTTKGVPNPNLIEDDSTAAKK